MREKSGASNTLMCTTSPSVIGPSERPPIDEADPADADAAPPEPCAMGMRGGRGSCAVRKSGSRNKQQPMTKMQFLNDIFLLGGRNTDLQPTRSAFD